MKKSLFLPLLLAAGLAVETAQADFLAVDPGNLDAAGTTTRDITWGYEVTIAPDSQYRVTALGVFDLGDDGLDQSHEVGLWTGDGSMLLASATVPSGTGGTRVDSNAVYFNVATAWRFIDLVSPVVLSTGSYLLGAFYASNSPDRYGEVFNANYGTITTMSGISFTESRRFPAASLTAPTITENFSANFGPSFLVEQVPEPATLALFGLGLAGVRAARRKRTAA